jgi:hypothetical protein
VVLHRRRLPGPADMAVQLGVDVRSRRPRTGHRHTD